MFIDPRVPVKYDRLSIKRNPEMESSFAELSLVVVLTPNLADQLGHDVVRTLFREIPKRERASEAFNDAYVATQDVGEVKFTFSVDPQTVDVFPVADTAIDWLLHITPVDITHIVAKIEQGVPKLTFRASFEIADREQLYQLVCRLLGEAVFLTFQPCEPGLGLESTQITAPAPEPKAEKASGKKSTTTH